MKNFTYLVLLAFLAMACNDLKEVTPDQTAENEMRANALRRKTSTASSGGTTSTTTTTSGGTTSTTTTTSGGTTTTLKPITGNSLDPTKLLTLINNTRAKGCTCGTTVMPAVAAVKWNALLETAAYKHSLDMFTKSYFSHISPTGTYPWDRVTAAGYKYSATAENIAVGYTTEDQVMAGWLASEGHCKNIMNAAYTEAGVGRSNTYWTMELGKPL
jgi:uncharacterized protein YkwD